MMYAAEGAFAFLRAKPDLVLFVTRSRLAGRWRALSALTPFKEKIMTLEHQASRRGFLRQTGLLGLAVSAVTLLPRMALRGLEQGGIRVQDAGRRL